MLGFKMNEIMVGTHHFINGLGPEGEFPMEFSITWGNSNLFKFLNPTSGEFFCNVAKGHITVGNLVDKADCEGSLSLLYFTERKIRYVLDFKDDDNRPYRYTGEKVNIWPWNLHKSHVTCYGTITDVELTKDISGSILYFPYREIMGFILSTRPVWGSVFKY